MPENKYSEIPVLEYSSSDTPRQRGEVHGSSHKNAIRDLVKIRTDLLYEKYPDLEVALVEKEAGRQFEITSQYYPELGDELLGISTGADVTLTDIVILNNFTDFRDVFIPEQGCSTIYIKKGDARLAGQTWDMHASAKDFVCAISIPEGEKTPAQQIFSLLGCTGMAGVNSAGIIVGVNNLTTRGARAGVIWPVFVRRLLGQVSRPDVNSLLDAVSPASGHNYLVGSPEWGEMREVTPDVNECTARLEGDEEGIITHTNHCLHEKMINIESKKDMPSTTHARYKLINQLSPGVQSLDELVNLLTSHEEYPASICSHFDNGLKDPSATCGGLAADLNTGEFKIWRGCPKYDDIYSEFSGREATGD